MIFRETYARTRRANGLGALGFTAALGLATGAAAVLLRWEIAAAAGAAVLAAALALLAPLLGAHLMLGSLIIVTDVRNYGHPVAWPLQDIDVIQGLPSALWLFFLLLFGLHVLSRRFSRSGPSRFPVRYLWLYAGILVVAWMRGISAGWNPFVVRTDLINFIIPVLLGFLCMNTFQTRARIHGLFGFLFVVSVLNAVMLCAFYLTGHGVPFTLGVGQKPTPIVTLDSTSLMTCVAMTLLALSWMLSDRARPAHIAPLVLCVLPMVFVIAFSFRRAEWVGLVAGVAMLWFAGTRDERRRLGIILLVILALVLAGGMVAMRVKAPAGLIARLHDRFHTLTSSEHTPNQHHVLEPIQAAKDILHSPILAMGLGGEHSPIPQFPRDTVPRHVVHNTWLYVWMKLGLAGFLLLAWAALLYLRRVRHGLRLRAPGPSRPILLTMTAVVPLFFMQFLTGPVPWYPHQTCLTVVFVCLTHNLMHLEGATHA